MEANPTTALNPASEAPRPSNSLRKSGWPRTVFQTDLQSGSVTAFRPGCARSLRKIIVGKAANIMNPATAGNTFRTEPSPPPRIHRASPKETNPPTYPNPHPYAEI